MSHIIIFDEAGNEIGRSDPGDEEQSGGNLAATEVKPIHIHLDLARMKDLMNGKEPDKKT